MGALLETIGNFIITLIQFIQNIITGTLQMIQMIPTALTFLFGSFATMPNVIAAFAFALVAVNVTYLIIGR